MAVTFEGYERRIDKINACLAENGISSLEEAEQICLDKGVNPREIVNGVQSIAFENAKWAYTLGCALELGTIEIVGGRHERHVDGIGAGKDGVGTVVLVERTEDDHLVAGVGDGHHGRHHRLG